jgi:hypothetical protein
MRQIALLVVLTIISLTAFAAPIPKEASKTRYFFPVEVGARWVYQWGKDKEDIRKVTSVEDKKGAKIVTVSSLGKDNNLSPREVVSVTERGLELLSEFGKELKPTVWLLKIPCKSGDKWKCDSTWFGSDVLGAEAKVHEIESLNVSAGKFNTIRVERTYALNSTSGGYQWNDWFAPGVGRIQMIEYLDGPLVAELKSFTPGR